MFRNNSDPLDLLRALTGATDRGLEPTMSAGGTGSGPPYQPATAPPQGYYLKGPISLEWCRLAAGAGPDALSTGLSLHWLVGCSGNVRVYPKTDTMRRTGGNWLGISQLAAAGLVRIEGKCITVLDVPPPPTAPPRDEGRMW